MAKILLIEDDSRLVKSLVDWLETDGHIVETVGDGKDAIQMLEAYSFDLIVLDWALPGVSGVDVLKSFREHGGITPVIFLTGQRDLHSKKSGLDSGADDYLTKPFEVEELSARIRSLLRRPAGLLPTTLTSGNVTIDPSAKSVTVDGASVKLGKLEFSILELLMRHPNKCFSAEDLMKQVWPSDTESSEDAVRSCVRALRRKLAPDGGDCIVKNIAGVGYIINSEL